MTPSTTNPKVNFKVYHSNQNVLQNFKKKVLKCVKYSRVNSETSQTVNQVPLLRTKLNSLHGSINGSDTVSSYKVEKPFIQNELYSQVRNRYIF